MARILLLGAGFSRTWGGLLASECFDYLIGMPTINEDQQLRQLLWNHRDRGGFEYALAEVQADFLREPDKYAERLRRLQYAILHLFEEMNRAFFALQTIEFQTFADRMLRTFLFRFDAIFTLNQDVLLEHHYFLHLDGPTGNRWEGAQLPGMKRLPTQETTHERSWGKVLWAPLQPAEFKVAPRRQPIFKLHGSSNWADTQGDQLLVIGGNKSSTIQTHPVLKWSFDKFREYLRAPNTKLLIIGYSFKDLHINEAIIDAVTKHRLRFFVIDPLGSNVVRHANPSFGGAIYAANELDDAFRNGLDGASERSLKETFGSDLFSHTRVMQFVE